MKKKSTKVAVVKPSAPTSLAAYSGEWGFKQAAHLLRRTMFGPTLEQIEEAVAEGLSGTLNKLFTDLPMPTDLPINYYFEKDPDVPVGEVWLNAPYNREANPRYSRKLSLFSWTMQQMLKEGVSAREKMVLFWHNHFVTSIQAVNDPKFHYHYISLFRSQPWGDFKQLVKDITIDPTMLRYLNGNKSTEKAPNENYARELLELFTIGKGPFAGPGDYTTFTEQDVLEIAKSLTGWRDRGFYTKESDVAVESYYSSGRHDKSDKQLSHRFNNAVIKNGNGQEYSQVIDIIFEQEEVSRFISRKLYRWFVYYKIDDQIEATVIEPMAQILRDNDYNIRPALMALLASEHFYGSRTIGPMIKHPIDFMISTLKQLQVAFPEDDLTKYYQINWQLFRLLPQWQMEYYNPPNVAGWKAYYQEPVYYRTWINSVTLPKRMDFTNLITSSRGFKKNGVVLKVDPLRLLQSMQDADDPNALIENFAKLLLPRPLTDRHRELLKEALIPGLPDYEWTVEYGQYLEGDNSLKSSLENKLLNLIRVMLTLPEYYLS